MNSKLKKSIILNSLTLGLFSIVTVGLIALTYVFTEDRIALQIREFKIKSLKEILPNNTYDNNIFDTRIVILPNDTLGITIEKYSFIAFKDGKPIAVILPAVAPDGYSGYIELLVGIYIDGTLAGVRVTNHKETPGLGDKIDIKISNWIVQFQGKSLYNFQAKDWSVKKYGGMFDQLTGATITSRAVIASVYQTLHYFNSHKEELFKKGEIIMHSLNEKFSND